MATTDLRLNLELTADGRILVNEVRRSSRSLDDMDESARRASRSTGSLDRSAGKLIGTLAGIAGFAGFAALASQIINVNREMEGLRVQLVSIEGDAKLAQKAFDGLQKFATQTPFQLQELTQSYIKLKAFGLQPTEEIMLAVTNQASKLGAESETLQGITLALGQAWSKGKLQGEEIMQLIERGVPVWDLLAKVTGKNAEQLQEMSSKGELGRDVISKLIDKMGEMASGSNANAMDTLNGKFSNLADSWTRFQDALLDTRAEGYIKDFVQGAIDQLDRLTSSIVRTEDTIITEIEQANQRLAKTSKGGRGGKSAITNHVEELQRELNAVRIGKQERQGYIDEIAALDKDIKKLEDARKNSTEQQSSSHGRGNQPRRDTATASQKDLLKEYQLREYRDQLKSALEKITADAKKTVNQAEKKTTQTGTGSGIHNIGPSDKEKESLRQAAKLIDSTATPLERLNKEIDQYKNLLDQGLISQEVYARALNDSGEKYNKLTDASKGLSESQRQAAQIINDIKTPLQQFNEEIALYSDLADKGLLSTEQLAAALNKAGKEYNGLPKQVKKANSEMQSFADSASKGLQDGFEQFLFDPFEKGLDGMLKGFADMLKKMAAEQATNAIFGKNGLNLGGLFDQAGSAATSFISGLFHDGGIVGQGGGTMSVNPLVFSGAPRFHSGGFPGLKQNEVPAILKKGEEVLTRNDPRNALNGGGSNPVIVNNYFTVQGSPSRKTEQQIANSAGNGIRDAMRRMS